MSTTTTTRRRPVTRARSRQQLVSASPEASTSSSSLDDVALPPIDTETTSLSLPPTTPTSHRKTIVLALLVLQNASVSLLTRMSRLPSKPGAAIYLPSVAVFSAELIKLSVSLTMLVLDRRRDERKKMRRTIHSAPSLLFSAISDLLRNQRREIMKLSIPAALYALQNTLLYTALSNLDAATYQTTYQLKLLTTALFSLLFFRRSLSLRQWSSLVLLTIGVATVQLETTSSTSSTKVQGHPNQDARIGLLAILAACVSSGLAGGWFEYVLKSPVPASPPSRPSSPVKNGSNGDGSPPSPKILQLRKGSPSLWARNLQLSVPSLICSFSGVMLSSQVSGGAIKVSEMWIGFTPLVWSVVLNQALGGLLVAMVVREADSVAKGFATSLAIVLSTLASAVFFGLIPGYLFISGATMVIGSTILYAMDKSG